MTTTLDIRDNLPAADAVRQGDAAAAAGGATTPTVAVAPLDDLLFALVEFAQRAGRGISFGRWPWSLIREYLRWHFHKGTLNYEIVAGEVRGLLIAWPAFAAEVQARAARDLPVFAWQDAPLTGDSIVIAQAIATHPGTLSRMIAVAAQRYPDWRARRLFTYRHGKLREYSPRIVHLVTQGELC